MRLKYFTLGIIILLCARSAHAATYTIDKREYVSNWCVTPYNKIVAFFGPPPGGNAYYPTPTCTGQYVAKDIILTALHCINYEGDPQVFQISNCKAPSKRWNAKIISKGANTRDSDWVLLRIQDPAGYSDDFFDVSPTTPESSNINNAGWGMIRRLSDEEITEIKNILRQYIAANPNARLDDLYNQVSQTINIDEPVLSGAGNYPSQLKANTRCAITGTYDKEWCANTYSNRETCQIHQRYFNATCNAQHGNSGGPYFLNNTLYGIVSRGSTNTQNFTSFDLALKNSVFYDELMAARAASPVTETPTSPVQQISTTPTSPVITSVTTVTTTEAHTETPTGPVQQTPVVPQLPTQAPSNTATATAEMPTMTVTATEEEITESETAIINEIRNIDNTSPSDVLNLVIKMADVNQLRKEYEATKAREQSIPNKLLGGLTMAATGIGGQMLTTGLAEQRADEAAERDMRAYLATFRCDYGQGRNITGGETNIQLPGSNELLQFVTEYKQLAASLKSDKEALGMMPGIESEIISDSANMGLYNNVSIGRGQGAFTSLSRALLDENSDDAKAWAEQTSAAHKQKNTGLTVGATGAGAGLAGNIVINGILNKDKKSDQGASQNVDVSNILNNATTK